MVSNRRRQSAQNESAAFYFIDIIQARYILARE